jgi:hypothetical protein
VPGGLIFQASRVSTKSPHPTPVPHFHPPGRGARTERVRGFEPGNAAFERTEGRLCRNHEKKSTRSKCNR